MVSSRVLTPGKRGEHGDKAFALELWPNGQTTDPYLAEQLDRYVRMALLDASLKIFQNIYNQSLNTNQKLFKILKKKYLTILKNTLLLHITTGNIFNIQMQITLQ